MARDGRLEEIPGIGQAIAAKTREFFETGRIAYHDELKAKIPAVLFEMVKIPGLGAKKARVLYEKLGVQSIGELEYACRENRLLELPGFGAKTQTKILAGIESLRRFRGRFLISDALPVAEAIADRLARLPGVTATAVAGSLRRRKETVGDIDIVVGANPASSVMETVATLPEAQAVIARGPTKTSVTLQNGLNVDVRLVTPAEYPSALHHFTGSKEHHIKLRGLARDQGLKISEYGVERPDGSIMPVPNEAALYRLLDLDYIEPELREGGDEIAAAREHRLPVLVREDQLRGLSTFIPPGLTGGIRWCSWRQRPDSGAGAIWGSATIAGRLFMPAASKPKPWWSSCGKSPPLTRRTRIFGFLPASRATFCPMARWITMRLSWPDSTLSSVRSTLPSA